MRELEVNGQTLRTDAADDCPLLYVLRNDGGLSGPRFGCGLGQCGACMVLVDDVPTRSCITPLEAADGARITTLEGLGSEAAPHPLQAAFIAEQAAQCGYCGNGMIMTAAALLAENPAPDAATVRRTLDGNLCRCGTHRRIVRAVLRAARAGGGRKP